MNMENKLGVFEERKEEYWNADKKRKGEVLDAIAEAQKAGWVL